MNGAFDRAIPGWKSPRAGPGNIEADREMIMNYYVKAHLEGITLFSDAKAENFV